MTTSPRRHFIMIPSRKMYGLAVTRLQIEKLRELNLRSAEPPRLLGRGHDFIEVVEEAEGKADMIGGVWFGMTIGILPDGSAHS